MLNKYITHKQAVDHLLLHGSLNEDFGLLYGQMGCVIALFEYGRSSSDTIITRLAQEMMKSLLEKLDESLPYGLAYGYAGIAWGICYLQYRAFIDENLSDLLEDIDAKVKELDISRVIDTELECGLEGLLHYVLIRTLLQPSFLAEDAKYMNDWDERLSQRYASGIDISDIELRYWEWRKSNSKLSYNPQEFLDIWINTKQESPSEFSKLSLGIKDGIAGLLFQKG